MKRNLILFVAVLTILSLLAGCTQQATDAPATAAQQPAQAKAGDENAAPAGAKKLKFAYICKKLNDEWFKAEDDGMKIAAAELGVEYVGYDVDYNNERCMQAVESVIADGFDGVMMCIPDAGLSMAVSQRFKEANIPLLAIDDYISDENGNLLAPYLGVPTYDVGYKTGLALIQMAVDRDFFNEKNAVKIMVLDLATIPTVHDTSLGHIAAIKEVAGGKVTDDMFIIADCKSGTFDESIAVATAAYNANPEVTHWIIPVPEDQVAYAAVKMLVENHFDFKNVVICGNGAYAPSKEIFEMGGDIANAYISAKFFPREEGEAAIKILYDYCIDGTPIPQDTRVGEGYVSIDNWKDWQF